MDDTHTIRTAHPNISLRAERDGATLRSSLSYPDIRAERDDITLRSALSYPNIRAERDDATLRSALSNPNMRAERDDATLRSALSNPNMRANKEDAAYHKNMSRQTFSEPQAQPVARSPSEANQAKKIYLSTIIGGTMMIVFIIFGIFSIFFGSLYRTPKYAHKLVGWVVDFDHGAVGSAVTNAVQQLPSSHTLMTWVVKDASEFPGGPEDLASQLHKEHAWFVVSVNPGASDALASAVDSPEQHTNYSGSLAITGYGEEARNENTYRTVLRPQFEAMIQPIISQFSNQFTARNISTLPDSQSTAILRDVPQVVTHPIHYTINNLRPFDVPVATAVTFVGLIFSLILSFIFAIISHGANEASGYRSNLSTGKLTALRYLTSITVYFFLSLFYCLLSLAFQAPFSRFLGKSGFVVYWMLQWIGMIALGLALEVMMTILTPRFIAAFLLLWLIADIPTASLPLELLPGIFRYGYAMPFYNISQGVRAIMFGTKNQLRLNFGVLFAWAGVSTIILPLATIFVRWLQSRSHVKDQAQQSTQAADPEAQNYERVETI